MNDAPLTIEADEEHFTVVGQLRTMYIMLETQDGLYLIDQHALAERIAFEKMKKRAAGE